MTTLDLFDTYLVLTCKMVYKVMKRGHRERTYQNALEYELVKRFNVIKEYPLRIMYGDVCVNNYFIDLVLDNRLPIEIKATKNIGLSEDLQIQNYMIGMFSEVGYLINFGVFGLEMNKYVGDTKIDMLEEDI